MLLDLFLLLCILCFRIMSLTMQPYCFIYYYCYYYYFYFIFYLLGGKKKREKK